MDAHRVSFLIYPGISPFDVAGPGKALALAAEGGGRYEVTLRSVKGGLIESDCPGVSFNSVPSLPPPPIIDTLFIPGGLNAATASKGCRWFPGRGMASPFLFYPASGRGHSELQLQTFTGNAVLSLAKRRSRFWMLLTFALMGKAASTMCRMACSYARISIVSST
jgi:hypothetical protein